MFEISNPVDIDELHLLAGAVLIELIQHTLVIVRIIVRGTNTGDRLVLTIYCFATVHDQDEALEWSARRIYKAERKHLYLDARKGWETE